MKNKLLYTFDQDLKKRLKNSKFRQAWKETESEYFLAKQLITKRKAKKISQRDLAKMINTSQAVISRIETMRANPSLSLLKRIAGVFNSHLQVRFQ